MHRHFVKQTTETGQQYLLQKHFESLRQYTHGRMNKCGKKHVGQQYLFNLGLVYHYDKQIILYLYSKTNHPIL